MSDPTPLFTVVGDTLPPDVTASGRRSKWAPALKYAKDHPGVWLHLGCHIPSSFAPLRKHGYELAYRNNGFRPGTKSKLADIYIRWPANTTPAPAKSRATTGEKVVACSTCDAEFPADQIAKLVRHCVTAHDRPVTRAERTPVAA